MANLKKILKNNTGSPITLAELGIELPASGQVTIEPGSYYTLAEEIDISGTLAAKIRADEIIVNDGVDDLIAANGFSVERGIDYLKHSDRAFNIRFEAQPERMNGFVAKNVQEAIEESKAAIEGKVSVLPTFLNNGLTKNKWLALDGAMAASDSLPAVTAFDSKLAAMTFINGNDGANTDLEFYKNGVLVFTWEIRDRRYAFKTDGLSGVSFLQGDRIGCFARDVAGTDPTSVIVFVNVQTVNSIVGGGGGSTLGY